MNYFMSTAVIRTLLDGADHSGIETAEAEEGRENFLRQTFTYRPRRVRLLYCLRAPWCGCCWVSTRALCRIFNLLLINRMARSAVHSDNRWIGLLAGEILAWGGV